MKLTIRFQVLPDAHRRAVLLTTMGRFVEAATVATRAGFEAGVIARPSIHTGLARDAPQPESRPL